MRICEIFDSLEGEGIRTGIPATFIRTVGCNLRCSYCDTLYSLDPAEGKEMTVDEIMDSVNKEYKRVTFTGGEPLLQNDAQRLIERLAGEGYEVNIETNGAADIADILKIDDPDGNIFFTMDYKLPSSGETERMLDNNFKRLREWDVVKFVAGSEEDIRHMDAVMEKYNLPNVFIGAVYGKMPYQRLVEHMLGNPIYKDARFQIQLHKVIWDPDMRGV